MKKISKILLFIVLNFILFPISAMALSKETDYISIYDSVDITLDSITLKNAHYDNPSDLSSFVTEIYNEDDSSTTYEVIISYYDKDFNSLGNSGKYDISTKGKISFSQNFYRVDKNKIKYFKLSINSKINNNSVIDNQETKIDTSGEYYISDYDIRMIVNENNTFVITEKITANFNVAKHGIYRKIPIKNTVNRLDGTKSNNRAKITDVIISDNYKSYRENGFRIFQIGDSKAIITGPHTYNISYKYNIGKDPLKNADELYFNLIGTEWDTHINNVTFSIEMPKDFDKTKLGFSSGSSGTANSENIRYEVDGNLIKGKMLKPLSSGEALTVRLNLSEGYFVGASYNIDVFSVCLAVIFLFFDIIAYILWNKYGRDDEVIETVEFYSPEGYNSAEIAFLYKGNVTSKDAVSLLLYLADKGYLKIEENGERMTGLLSKRKDFKITKLKEYDGNNECERIFFDELFNGRKNYSSTIKANEIRNKKKQNGEKISFYQALQLANEDETIKNSVTGNDLYYSFYKTIDEVKKEITKKLKSKIFEPYDGNDKMLISMIIIVMVLIITPSIYEGNSGVNFIGAMLMSLIFPISGLYLIISGIRKKSNFVSSLILGSIFMGMIIIPVSVQYALIENSSYILPTIVAIISIIVLIIFIAIMPKRTKFGNEILGKIRGFRNFLQTAEKTKLESLVSQNPEYFYNILPYTYALGVSEIWMKQFETISMQAPRWYDSKNTFNINDFNDFISSTMQSAQSTMTSSSSSDSGGTGGGSSGGGSGGGGGGSW